MRKVGVEPTATGNAHRWIGGAPQRRLSFAWRPQNPSITRRPANPRPGPTHVNTQLAGWLLPDAANCQPSANLNLNFIQKKTKIQVGKSSNTFIVSNSWRKSSFTFCRVTRMFVCRRPRLCRFNNFNSRSVPSFCDVGRINRVRSCVLPLRDMRCRWFVKIGPITHHLTSQKIQTK